MQDQLIHNENHYFSNLTTIKTAPTILFMFLADDFHQQSKKIFEFKPRKGAILSPITPKR